jgi:Mg2+ and Co2+ transporter CorA
MGDIQTYIFLIVGAFCLLIASLFAGNVEFVLGTTENSFYLTLLISFILILIAGIFWISAARILNK